MSDNNVSILNKESKMDCSNVYIAQSKINPEFDGAFSRKDFNRGEVVEYGIARVIDLDGNKNQFVFTWSDDIPNHTWALTSGCITFYNTSLNPNIILERNFEANTFRAIAKTDIKEGDELTHQYKSLKWRKCFTDLYENLSKN